MSKTSSRWRYVLTAVAAVASLLLLLRAIQGAGPSKSTVNMESLTAAFLVAAITLSKSNAVPLAQKSANNFVCLCLLLISIPFVITLRSPFLFDTYSHVVRASQESFSQAISSFYRHPVAGDFFFRPLGYLDYWLESKRAGFSFVTWRLGGICLHLVASLSLFALCTKAALSRGACLFAALIFGLHGSNPEVVSWTAARFDELATCFSITTLIFLCRYVDDGRHYSLMILACLCAMLSKEAALCLPGLAICMLLYRGRFNGKRPIKAVIGLASTCLVVLIYRFWVLGGIGGYRNASGQSTALQFNLLHSIELFLFRMWSVLMLPINWSVPSQWWLSLALALALIGFGLIMMNAEPAPRKRYSAVAFCLIALLPVAHLGLLDSTLLGSRVYHLSMVGLALLFGAIYDGFSNVHTARIVAGSLILFHVAALSHNLLIWRDTAQLAGQVCRTFPVSLRENETVVIPDLPKANNGVYFLSNGFSECVLVNSGKKIKVLSASTNNGSEKSFRWDENSKSLISNP